MTTFFKKWDTLINEELLPTGESINLLSEVEIEGIIQDSAQEVENVQNLLIEYVLHCPTISDKQEFVKFNQALLIRLLDKLYLRRNHGVREKAVGLYCQLENHLQATLDFIEDFFNNYFDKNEKVPAPYLEFNREEIDKRLEKLTLAFSISEMNSFLANIIVDEIKKFTCCKIEKPVSYYDLSYHKILLEGVLSLNHICTHSIRKMLYQLNFNELSFIEFEYEQLNSIIETADTRIAKISALKFEQKTINQYPEKINIVFDPTMPSLKHQVNSWIKAEIQFLENSAPAENLQTVNADVSEKINTSLSVAKLALIIRLLVVDKIIINRTVAPMLRVIAKMVTTLQKDEISFGSLETKYHAPDKATITAVRDMLFKWINIIGKL